MGDAAGGTRCRPDNPLQYRAEYEGAAKCDGQMHVIAAHSHALAIDVERRSIGAGLHVIEANVLVDENCHTPARRPARRQLAEQRPRRMRSSLSTSQ